MATKTECVKMAATGLYNFLGKGKFVSSFERKADALIGEELIHRLTGRRFFKATELNAKSASVSSCPVEITESGYRGISREQFEALKNMKLRLKEGSYGHREVADDFTGQIYWGRKRTDGSTLFMTENRLGTREAVNSDISNKITALFGDIGV